MSRGQVIGTEWNALPRERGREREEQEGEGGRRRRRREPDHLFL